MVKKSHLLIILLFLIFITPAQAIYLNNQSFNQGDGIWLKFYQVTANNYSCCVNNTMSMNISNHSITWTAGANKTITNPTHSLDNFTFDVTGAAYLNFSVSMQYANNNYSLFSNGTYVESRNTSSSGAVWFNYTESGTISVYQVFTYPPSFTSWGNSNTSNNTLNFSINIGSTVIFNATANQTLTGCMWGGATQINCTSNYTYASKTFSSLGLQSVNVTGTNSNGSTQTIFWLVDVNTTAAPSLSQVSPGSYSVLSSGASQTFTTSTDQVVNYHWTVDGVPVTGAVSFLTSWSNGLHHVNVYADNANGVSNMIEWRISVSRLMAVTPVPTINMTPFNEAKQAVRAYNFDNMLASSIVPYTNVFGYPIFWLFCWAMIFVAYWIRQRQVTFPTVIALVFGGVVIGSLPEEYQVYAKGIIAVGVFAVIYLFFSERRS